MGGLGKGAVIAIVLKYIGGMMLSPTLKTKVEGGIQVKQFGCFSIPMPVFVDRVGAALMGDSIADIVNKIRNNPIFKYIMEAKKKIAQIIEFIGAAIALIGATILDIMATIAAALTTALTQLASYVGDMLGLAVDNLADGVIGSGVLGCMMSSVAKLAKKSLKGLASKMAEKVNTVLNPLKMQSKINECMQKLQAAYNDLTNNKPYIDSIATSMIPKMIPVNVVGSDATEERAVKTITSYRESAGTETITKIVNGNTVTTTINYKEGDEYTITLDDWKFTNDTHKTGIQNICDNIQTDHFDTIQAHSEEFVASIEESKTANEHLANAAEVSSRMTEANSLYNIAKDTPGMSEVTDLIKDSVHPDIVAGGGLNQLPPNTDEFAHANVPFTHTDPITGVTTTYT